MITCPTWKELKAIVRNDDSDKIKNFLNSLPNKHRTAGALALSVAHWHPSEREWIKETHKFGANNCGLCVQFGEGACAKCPLNKVSNCHTPHSLWSKVATAFWNDEIGMFNLRADKLYNVLVDLYRKEWEKL